ncbi:MAG: photosynthetic reaction center subunit H [Pseudomonadota bacterium]
MQFGDITGYMDWAQLSLYAFWFFFAGLIYYIQYEGRREGFPLVNDPDGTPLNQDIWMPTPKTFITNDGRTRVAPNPADADTRELNAEWVVGGPGSPIVPTGNPLTDSIGPAAYTERADVADLTFEGHDRIVPMRIVSDFEIPERDIDPRGTPLIGADGKQAGTITDVWVDRSDYVIRYLEAEVATGTGEGASTKNILVPWNLVDIKSDRDWFMEFIRAKSDKVNAEMHVYALTSDLFAGVPTTKNPERITYLEEEKIFGYFGGGYMWATKDRAEPMI